MYFFSQFELCLSNKFLKEMHQYMSRNMRQNQQNECAPSEDSDQPGHPPSLIRVFAVCMKKAWVVSYTLITQRRLCSGWADAQDDPSLRWAHTHFVCFVMLQLISKHASIGDLMFLYVVEQCMQYIQLKFDNFKYQLTCFEK